MKGIVTSAYDIAQRFVGIKEVVGTSSNSQILAMLHLDQKWPRGDEVPWCSAFMNYVAWLLRLPRSKNLRARSWLTVGRPIPIDEAEAGFDVVVLKQEAANQPGPDVIEAPGHVGLFAGRQGNSVLVLGGNQSDMVNVKRFRSSRVLGIRRLH